MCISHEGKSVFSTTLSNFFPKIKNPDLNHFPFSSLSPPQSISILQSIATKLIATTKPNKLMWRIWVFSDEVWLDDGGALRIPLNLS
ncbi:hypothetical protein HanIR_Chr08g0343631 [Helianthus annuus]|nr:hypothetical protein HanIR_Chr08g0343631 [Helianthus annuus]